MSKIKITLYIQYSRLLGVTVNACDIQGYVTIDTVDVEIDEPEYDLAEVQREAIKAEIEAAKSLYSERVVHLQAQLEAL